MIRLLFVDDHPIIASGLVVRYAAMPAFAVAGSATSVPAALRVLAEGIVDVAVVDVHLETVLTPRQVDMLSQYCRVVLFSARSGDPYVRQLLAASAVAAVDKSVPLAELDAVLVAAHAGKLSRPNVNAPTDEASRAGLSDRELDVYRALTRCQTPKEVAASLGVARSTVYCHIESIRRKLGVQTLPELVARAFADERA